MFNATASFPSVFSQLLQYSRQHPSFSAHSASLMTKSDLTFQHFIWRLQISQFDSAFAVSFQSTRSDFRLEFHRTNHNSLLRIAANEIAVFCIDNRLRQMAFFVFAKVGKGRLSSYVERFWNKKSFICSSLFRYYIKQIDSILTLSVIYYCTDTRQHGIYLLNRTWVA